MTETQDIDTLVRKCQAGDREAFGILYQTYLDPMQEVVSYYVKDAEAVWDILHDGFLIAFVSISSLRNTSKIVPWLTSIMKNLALQYLKEEMKFNHVPLSDELEEYNVNDEDSDGTALSWEELSTILDKLPEGYGKVFRLAVLDGLSHKEIGAMLGIAPHSSSSQLVRAKAMLRRLIRQYRVEMGLLSIIVLIMFIRHLVPEHEDLQPSVPVLSSNEVPVHTTLPDTSAAIHEGSDSVNANPKTIYKLLRKQKSEETKLITEVVTRDDIVSSDLKDSIPGGNATPVIQLNDKLNDRNNPIAKQEKRRSSTPDWSLALAYSGTSGHNNANNYSIPAPSDPDLPTDAPSEEVEVTETTRHKMPVIIGLSLSKPLTSRWSIETGVRYSFMESVFRSESKLSERRVNQQIHYIGILLKFNYRIYSVGGFSLYGQGGGALDIPVSGQQSVRTLSIEMPSPEIDNRHIHAPLQWSVEGGLGIQYHFTPKVSIFAEPSVHYYFNPGGEIKTIRQEKPFEFTLPVGLRLTW